MKRIVALLVVGFIVSFALPSVGLADLTQALAQLHALQASSTATFELVRDKDGGYLLQHETTKPIAAAAAKDLPQRIETEEWPIIDSGCMDSNLVVTYKRPDGDRVVQRISLSDESSQDSYDLVTTITDARVAVDEFRAFLSKVQDDLLFCNAEKQDDAVRVEIGLMPPCPDTLRLGAQTFQMTKRFRSYMKVAKDGSFTEGDSGKCVIIVHEPHWDTTGQYTCLLGLHEFIQSNRLDKSVFVMEGGLQNKRYEVDSLLKMIPAGANPRRITSVLLGNHVIVNPIAYMALHGGSIEAWGMEDPVARGKTPRTTSLDSKAFQEALVALDEAAKSLPGENGKDVQALLGYLVMEFTGQVSDVNEQKIIAGLKERAEVAKTLGGLADAMEEAGATIKDLPRHRKTLADVEEHFGLEVASYEHADLRSRAMADNIVKRASSTVPVFAFIGNFHTASITKALKEKGINYLVIEAIGFRTNSVEEQDYKAVLDDLHRADYFKRVPKRTIEPDLWNDYPEAFEEMIARAETSLQQPANDLAALLNDNPFFCDYRAGQVSSPAADLEKALLVADPRGAVVQVNPTGKERMNDLQAVLPYIPLFARGEEVTVKRSLHQVRIGERMISVVFDGESGLYYIFDGRDEGLNLLEPISKMADKIILRWRLTRIPLVIPSRVS